jgi:hypothetical protein
VAIHERIRRNLCQTLHRPPPEPLSLKEQARVELDRLVALIPAEGALAMAEPIRRALEALPND